MTVFLKNIQMAWLGWKNYTDNGKLAALLLAVLLFLWCYRKRVRELPFLVYSTIITCCCILPVTASLLMMYQTEFYDYEWIWSLVPVTAMTAYGLTILMADCWEDFKVSGWRRGIPVTLLLLVLLMLSGGMGGRPWDVGTQRNEKASAERVLEQLANFLPHGEICLWAPREIMEYARELDGRITLPYGRNMWDESLNAYAYDIYDEKITDMYRWMEQATEAGMEDAGELSMEKCVQNALDMGVNCILLPGDTAAGTVKEMEKALQMDGRLLEGYWIFYGRADQHYRTGL